MQGGIFSETSLQSQAPTHSSSLSAILCTLNTQFHQAHQQLTANFPSEIQYVFIFKGGELSLWSKMAEQYQRIDSQMLEPKAEYYHDLKSICHIPILILDLIYRSSGSFVSLKPVLEEVLSHVIPVLPCGKDVTKIVKVTIEYIEKLQQQRDALGSTSSLLSIFALYQAAITDSVQKLVAQSTEIQLKTLHSIVTSWVEKYCIDWGCARVLLVGTHGPRAELIEMQYFLDQYRKSIPFQQNIENNYVYYVEMLGSQIEKVDIQRDLIQGFLLSEELNKEVGLRLLGDSMAMERDVLGSYAPPILQRLSLSESRCILKENEKTSRLGYTP